MSPQVLLDRQLARLSGIDLSIVRSRQFDDSHTDRLDQAMNTIAAIGERLNFVNAPYDLANCAAAVDDHQSDILILDYAQRVRPPGQHGDRRGAVDALMDFIRRFCDAGMAVVVVSAVGRGRDSSGKSSYAADALSLASFRESSELEFGADDAYIIAPEDEEDRETVIAKHLKARHREPKDIELKFDRARQSFSVAAIGQEWNPNEPAKPKARRDKSRKEPKSTNPSMLAELKRRWSESTSAPGEDGDDE
jgi:replicative DNA helicase